MSPEQKQQFTQAVGAMSSKALVEFAAKSAGLTSAHAVREQLILAATASVAEEQDEASEEQDEVSEQGDDA